MGDVSSSLTLQKLSFEKISFERIKFEQNKNDVDFQMAVQIGRAEDRDNNYKVTLILNGKKPEEYEFSISLVGFFSVEREEAATQNVKEQDLINRNAVAIMMPYLRSEVSLLTAQPETDCVVLPPINVNKLFDNRDTNEPQ